MDKTPGKRVNCTITEDMAEQMHELKRTEYFDKPYSAMYRDLIARGLKSHQLAKRRAERAEAK